LSNLLINKDYVYNGEVTTVIEGDKVGNFVVIDTPGHTIGGKCFYHEESKLVIVGDTMFKGSYGRYDLPTADGKTLFKSLKKLCERLPLETKVYNGHTEVTTIGEEKKNLEYNGLI
jgi:hydroxyacylglutathione hydrolase